MVGSDDSEIAEPEAAGEVEAAGQTAEVVFGLARGDPKRWL
jgi:hypothetical protein